MNPAEARKRLNALLAERKLTVASVKVEREALSECNEHLEAIEQAQSILQEIAESVQNKAHHRIASIVTKCLQATFEDDLAFRIRFEKKRGKTEAELAIEEDGFELDPATGTSGGALDVAALALRLVRISLAQPALRKLIVSDEPYRFVHGTGEQARVAKLLQALAKEMGFQIVYATDDKWLYLGEVVEM